MITITNPKGVDVPIQRLQQILADELWTGFNVEVYGRVFPFQQSDQLKPVIHTSGSEYIEVLQDDTKDATVFFDLMGDVEIEEGQHSVTVGIVFSVNLEKLYPGGTYRTEYVEADALAIINNSPFTPERIIKGETAFDPYTYESDARVSMYPFYAFRIVTKVSYLPETC